MPASRADISRWFDQAVERGATHMIVKCDTFDYRGGVNDQCCYPVYVMPGEDARERAKRGDRLMEVYSTALPKDDQLRAPRAFNY